MSQRLSNTFTPIRMASLAIRGFTAVELMVALSIVAILATLAAPTFNLLIERWRVRDAVESMRSTLLLARSEAIKRGGGISIQKLPKTTPGCSLANTNQEWGCGWFVFEDRNNDGKWQVSEPRLQTVTTPININVIHNSGGTSIKVDRYGMMSGLNAKGFAFAPEPAGISSPATRGLCMSSGGRIRVIEDIPCS